MKNPAYSRAGSFIGREQPSVLELYNFIIETSDHYSNLCKELEAIRSYEPKDEALVMV